MNTANNRNHTGVVTVQMLIDSLKNYPADAPVEIQVEQYGKKFPVAYCSPEESIMVDGSYATMRNGQNVRIHIGLPQDENTFMIVQTRKKTAMYK